MGYIIQATITKISSDDFVEIKGCEGYALKKDGKDINLLLECEDNKSVKNDGRFCLREQCEKYEFDAKLVVIFRDAACNNKKVELVILDDYKTIESVTILA